MIIDIRFFKVFLPVIVILIASCGRQMTSEEYIASGQAFVSQSDWKSAIIEFKNAVKISPDNATARVLLGKANLNGDNYNAAIRELSRAIELGISKDEVIVPLGKAYSRVGKHQKIIETIVPDKGQSKSVQSNIYSFRARAYLALGDRATAHEALSQAKELDENSTETRLAWAWFERSNGDVVAQLDWLKPLRDRDGGNYEAWSLIGEVEQNANRLEAAEEAYSRSIELKPYANTDLIRRSQVRIALGNYSGAQTDIDALVEIGAKSPLIDHASGLLSYHLEKYDDAQSKFTEALTKSPSYAPAQLMLGLINFRNNNLQSASGYFQSYLATHPDEYRANYTYASTLIRLKKPEKALTILKKLYSEHPEDIAVSSLMASAYKMIGKSDDAVRLLRQVIQGNPDNAQIRLQLGTILLSNPGSVREGQLELIKAINLDSGLTQADLALFRSYMRQKQFSKARSVARNLYKKQKGNAQGPSLVALSLLGEGKKEKAIAVLLEVLNRFPDDLTASDILARIYQQNRDFQKAKALYENIINKDPGNLKALTQMALVSAREGESGEVIQWLRKAIDRNPDQLSPKFLLAMEYLRQNYFMSAAQVLSEVKAHQTHEPGYMLLMARAKIGLKEYQHATRLLKSLISLNSEVPLAHYLLAQVYQLEGKPDLMRASLESIVDKQPGHLSANVALAKLELFEGNIQSFEKRVEVLFENFPEHPEIQLLNAKVASKEKNYSQAINTLSLLMEKVPNSEVALDLSRNQWMSGDKLSAISGLELWIQSQPEDIKARMLLARYYLAENLFDQAKETYLVLDNLLPENPVVLNNLAWLMKDSNPAQGLKYASKALKLVPDNPLIKDTLAMLYLQTGDRKSALRFSEEAAAAVPDLLDIQLHYATILEQNNLIPKARDKLNALLLKSDSSVNKQLIQDHLARLDALK